MKYRHVTWKKIPIIYIYTLIKIYLYLLCFTLLCLTLLTAHFINHIFWNEEKLSNTFTATFTRNLRVVPRTHA